MKIKRKLKENLLIKGLTVMFSFVVLITVTNAFPSFLN